MSLAQRARPVLLAALAGWFVCPGGEASAGASSTQPYHLVVVLHFTENRELTPLFRGQVERELRDGLQAAYGDLARVDVTTTHPRLKAVLDRGLDRLEEAMAGWDDPAGRAAKTHFVFFDFAGGEYQIRARQFDGPTGQASPIVRTEHKPREFAPRAAALLVDRDFGLSGTFTAWPRDARGQPGSVTLELQGAGLGVPLSRWVKKGDVFSVVQMPVGPGAGWPIEFALVQVQEPPRDDDPSGACPGRLFWRYEPPADSGGGYRCLRLGAGKETLRLRLVNRPRPGSPPEPERSRSVQVRRNGFGGEEREPLQGTTDNVIGAFKPTAGSDTVFDRVAFVTVLTAPVAHVPVALLDDRPVVIPVDSAKGVGDLTALRARDWNLSLAQSWLVHTGSFKEIGKLAQERRRDDAVAKAKEALARTRDDVSRLERERKAIQEEARESHAAAPDFSPQQEKTLEELKKGETELRGFLERQEALDQQENSPAARTAKEQVESGKLQERELEFGKAIEAYEAAIRGGVDDPKLREHVDKLKGQWQTKGMAHEKARDFIYNVWPKLDTQGLEREVGNARASFEECKRAGDVIGLRKLEKEVGKHALRLEDEFNKLRVDIQNGRENEAKRIEKVSAELGKLAKEVADYLAAAKTAAEPAPGKK